MNDDCLKNFTKRLTQRGDRILIAVTALYFLVFHLCLGLRTYWTYQLANFDYAIEFSSIIKIFSSDPFVSLRGARVLADNQSYISALLKPLTLLPQAPLWILGFHALMIWLPGFLIFFFRPERAWAAFAIAVFYWSSPFTLNLLRDSFHPEAFATAFLILTALGVVRKSRLLFVLGLLLALLCKEDVALTAGALCFGFLLTRKLSASFAKPLLGGLSLSVVIFLFNYFYISPHEKMLTCVHLGLSSDQLTGSLLGPNAPWFRYGPQFQNLFSIDSLKYVLSVCWPLVFTFGKNIFVTLAVVPGLIINSLGGAYLIEGLFHYDHSTIAIVMIALILNFQKLEGLSKKLIPSLFLLVALGVHLRPVSAGDNLSRLWNRETWNFQVDQRVARLDVFSRSIPETVWMSTDYKSAAYMIHNHQRLFMYPNPLKDSYFGITDLCMRYNEKSMNNPGADLFLLDKTILPLENLATFDSNYSQIYESRDHLVFVRKGKEDVAKFLDLQSLGPRNPP